ncbi:lipopolysaccharide transport periplasmic protein LptA [Rugamonas sp.]|uniref:lipopolysaccharide transport periplasmic protein LptA n=1 Tax=Rugamonas sp. TaxID=1926287 RepID=UPI0025D87A3E|nr:lipopolysaccharide transport periplasmic protein LptA [Rugamonas sp.]
MKKYLLSAAWLMMTGLAGLAHAEKADSDKPTEIKYDQVDIDDVKQIRTFTGNVVLTRGTLLMKAAKAVLTVDPENYQYVTMTAANGVPATFRQKRDGAGDQWIEGEAQRIEYDGKIELVKLFTNAKVRRLEGSRVSDEAQNEFISYDSRKEFFSLKNSVTGESVPGKGRGSMVIQPALKPTGAAPAKGAAPAAAPATPAPVPMPNPVGQ